MITTQKKANFLIIAALMLGPLVEGTSAAVTITNFTISPTSVTFDVSGNLPASPPPRMQPYIFFANPILKLVRVSQLAITWMIQP